MSYGLYIAKIVGTCSDTDSRLQVKILPQMTDISDTMCPKWPYFFRDELLTGKVGDLVWCICNDNFDSGYVLGLANYTTYSDDAFTTTKDRDTKKEIQLSIPHESLKEKIHSASVELLGSSLNFNDIKVTHWNNTSIHFVERSTGGFVVAFAVGSMMVMRPTEFFVHVGTSSSGGSLKVDSAGCSIQGDAIKLQSSSVGLGDNPTARVLVTNGDSYEGSFTSSYVKA